MANTVEILSDNLEGFAISHGIDILDYLTYTSYHFGFFWQIVADYHM